MTCRPGSTGKKGVTHRGLALSMLSCTVCPAQGLHCTGKRPVLDFLKVRRVSPRLLSFLSSGVIVTWVQAGNVWATRDWYWQNLQAVCLGEVLVL